MTHATTAVILARGLGTRMRAPAGADSDSRPQRDGLAASAQLEFPGRTAVAQPGQSKPALSDVQAAAAAAGAKGLMPIGDAVLLDYVLHDLADGGISDIVFVVAPGASLIRERYSVTHPPQRLVVHFAEQHEPLGTADALLASQQSVEGISAARHEKVAHETREAHFLVLNSDNLYPVESISTLVHESGPSIIAYEAAALSSMGNIEPARVLRFALLDLIDSDAGSSANTGTLRAIVEKPSADNPLLKSADHWVSMNLWRFNSAIFPACNAVTPSPRGELELADAVNIAIARGVSFAVHKRREGVLDLSQRSDVAAVEARLANREPRP